METRGQRISRSKHLANLAKQRERSRPGVIVTHNGTEIYVDEDDMELALSVVWHLTTPTPTGVVYARTGAFSGSIFLHNLILPPKTGLTTDHKDQNGLNNRRSNLRYATKSQQSTNRRRKWTSSSAYRGVSWNERSKKWQVILQVEGSLRRFGMYAGEIEAARVADKVARELYGEFAKLNFPGEHEDPA